MYASVIHFHVFFSGFSLKNRHFRKFTPFCAISGYVRHLALINIPSNMRRRPTSASVIHFHVFFSGFSLKNRHFRQFTPFWRHFAPFCAISGYVRHLALINILSNMCRSPTSASVFHFHVFFTGFSLKNRHFRQFTPFWRHLAPFPVMSGTWRSSIYHLTCVGDLRLLLLFISMSFSQVFH